MHNNEYSHRCSCAAIDLCLCVCVFEQVHGAVQLHLYVHLYMDMTVRLDAMCTDTVNGQTNIHRCI